MDQPSFIMIIRFKPINEIELARHRKAILEIAKPTYAKVGYFPENPEYYQVILHFQSKEAQLGCFTRMLEFQRELKAGVMRSCQ